MVLLHEIEEFIHKMQLTTEETILRQIYPAYFAKIIREKCLAQFQSQNQDEPPTQGLPEKSQKVFSDMFDEYFSTPLRKLVDPQSVNFVPLRKDKVLPDIKNYLYNLCTTGQLYSAYHSQLRIKRREDKIVAEHVAKAMATGRGDTVDPIEPLTAKDATN